METYLALAVAALAEIAGCFAFWTWLRQDESMLWLAPGMVAFGLSAYLPTLAESEAIGRAYAAYDGIYIAAAKPGDRGREPNIAGAGSSVWFRAAYRPG